MTVYRIFSSTTPFRPDPRSDRIEHTYGLRVSIEPASNRKTAFLLNRNHLTCHQIALSHKVAHTFHSKIHRIEEDIAARSK